VWPTTASPIRRKPRHPVSGIVARAEASGEERNWLATPRGKGYFAILRLYSPTEAAIKKTWKPGDITKVK
jgi:hypothetical protein